jgi:hypothetical protein
MKTKNIITLSILTAFIAFGFTACKDDNPKPENPEELITTVKLLFTDSADNSNTAIAVFADPDGPGGNSPVTTDTIKLQPNKTYYASIILLDESKNPVDTISNEVAEEKNDHLFVYTTTTTIGITVTDVDDNNLPVGLASKWKTQAPITGTTTVKLKHQPDIKTGDPALGETDVEVGFATWVE